MPRPTRLIPVLLLVPALVAARQQAPAAPRIAQPALETYRREITRSQLTLARMERQLAVQRQAIAASAGQLSRQRLTTQAARASSFGGSARLATLPPAPWASQDPGDSLYRAARQALNRNEYARSIELLQALRTRYPRSAYTPDAYYWEAYGLMRRGQLDQLRTALGLLEVQAAQHPGASTRNSGDARALETRIRGELARMGDASAAAALATAAAVAAVEPPPPPPAPSPSPSVAQAPRPPRPPAGAIASSRPSRSSCGDDDEVQVAALNALHNMDAARALPILKQVLARRDAASTCLRRRAVFIASQHEGPETQEILLTAARNDPDREVREQAVFWLSQVPGDRAAAALDSILFHAKEPAIQERALFALSQHESPLARRGLRRYAERSDISNDLREKAIFWLGQTGDAEDQAFLISMYGRVSEASLKERILFSIGQSDHPNAGRFLLDVARNGNEALDTRKRALFWLGQRSHTSGAEVGALYGTFADREIKEHLIFVLSQMTDKAATDKLIDIARREPDKDLRKRAIFWLSQSDDPRVADILAEFLTKP